MEEQDLLASGYRLFDSRSISVIKPGAKAFYQKCFKDGDRTLYSINLLIWPHPLSQFDDQYVAEVNFYEDEESHHWYKVEVCGAEKLSVSQLEARVQRMYTTMGFVPDIHN